MPFILHPASSWYAAISTFFRLNENFLKLIYRLLNWISVIVAELPNVFKSQLWFAQHYSWFMTDSTGKMINSSNTVFGQFKCAQPSLAGSGRLTTYWRTSSSFFKLNNLRILDARFGPRRLGIVTSVSPGISCSPAPRTNMNSEEMWHVFATGQVLKAWNCVHPASSIHYNATDLFMW